MPDPENEAEDAIPFQEELHLAMDGYSYHLMREEDIFEF